MIETTVKELRKQEAQYALMKIKQCTGFDPGYGFQIGCVVRDIEKQFFDMEQEAYKKYAELAEKDEDGKPKLEDRIQNGVKFQTYVFSDENKAVADEIAKTTGENKVIVSNRPKLNLSKLIGAKLNPVELLAIEFMIDETK